MGYMDRSKCEVVSRRDLAVKINTWLLSGKDFWATEELLRREWLKQYRRMLHQLLEDFSLVLISSGLFTGFSAIETCS